MVSSKSSAVPPHQLVEVADGAPPVASPIPVSSIATLKVAVNRRVKNKIPFTDAAALKAARRTFRNRELAPEDFIGEVSAGFAFCPWLRGSRCSSNFWCMQVLAVDVDSGLTIDEVLEHGFFQMFGWFIYTTSSHKPDAHRFRVVLLLELPIDTVERMKLAYNGIRLLLGGGLRCDDASRMFYGLEGCEVYRVGHVLPADQLEYVIELGRMAKVCHTDIPTLWRGSTRRRLSHASDRPSIMPELMDSSCSHAE